MVPSRRRIQMTHEEAVSMAALAQDDERGQADPSLRNLSGLQRSVRGSEATELAVRGHAQRTPPRAFQPCCGTAILGFNRLVWRGSQTFYNPRHFDGRFSEDGEPMTD